MVPKHRRFATKHLGFGHFHHTVHRGITQYQHSGREGLQQQPLLVKSFLSSPLFPLCVNHVLVRIDYRFPPSITPNTELEAVSSLSTPLVVGDSESVLQHGMSLITHGLDICIARRSARRNRQYSRQARASGRVPSRQRWSGCCIGGCGVTAGRGISRGIVGGGCCWVVGHWAARPLLQPWRQPTARRARWGPLCPEMGRTDFTRQAGTRSSAGLEMLGGDKEGAETAPHRGARLGFPHILQLSVKFLHVQQHAVCN